jgi:tetratricopeptide (TPR) repeat protein
MAKVVTALTRGLVGIPTRGLRWLATHPNVSLAIFGVAVCAASTIVARKFVEEKYLSAEKARKAAPFVSLEICLAELDAGRLDRARDLAFELSKTELPDSAAGIANYVAGASAARESEEVPDEERGPLVTLAAHHLAMALELGLPEDREAGAAFLLGRSLLQLDKVVEGRAALEHALKVGYQPAVTLHQMLADAYLRAPEADPEKSIVANQAVQNSPELTPEEQDAARLQQAEILFKVQRPDDAWAVLEKLQSKSLVAAEAALLRGRIRLQAGDALRDQFLKGEGDASAEEEITARYADAGQWFRRAQSDNLHSRTVRKGMYLSGMVLLRQGDERAALNQFARARDIYPATHEGMAAGLREAELLRKFGKDDKAVEVYLGLLQRVPSGQPFTNAWIPRDQFADRIKQAYQYYLNANDYERALAIAEQLAPLEDRTRAEELVAEVHQIWALRLGTRASEATGEKGAELRQQERHHKRQEAEAHLRMAGRNFTQRRYTKDAWNAAVAFLDGHDYTRAASTFQLFLEHEPVKQRPRALVGLGEAYLSLRRLDPAIEALRECIEFYPNDAASYRARYLAAQAHWELGNAKAAEELLREILTGGSLSPESREWRNSQFLLGELLTSQARHDEGVALLEEFIEREATERGPNNLHIALAHYLAGQSYQQAALEPQQKLLSTPAGPSRSTLHQRIVERLEKAVDHYKTMQSELINLQEQGPQTAYERALLRNSFFAEGSALYDMDRFEEAIKVYSEAVNQFSRDPEVLAAHVQIAQCHRRLGRSVEARGRLQQAKLALDRIPSEKDSRFAETTNFDRVYWDKLLTWMAAP